MAEDGRAARNLIAGAALVWSALKPAPARSGSDGGSGCTLTPAASLVLILAGLPVQAEAAIPDAALTLYAQGAYLDAAALAGDTAMRDRDGMAAAFAARARLAQITVAPFAGDAGRILETAESDARRAVDLAPDLPEGHLQLAIALGYKARRSGSIAAHVQGLATQAREHIDIALGLDPDNPFAHAVLGGWHLEIVTRAGASLAGLLYDASLEAGEAAFARARALDPKTVLFDVQYAVALLSLDPRAHGDAAEAAIATALRKSPADALETFMLDMAADLRALIDRGRITAVTERIARFQGIRVQSTSAFPESTR